MERARVIKTDKDSITLKKGPVKAIVKRDTLTIVRYSEEKNMPLCEAVREGYYITSSSDYYWFKRKTPTKGYLLSAREIKEALRDAGIFHMHFFANEVQHELALADLRTVLNSKITAKSPQFRLMRYLYLRDFDFRYVLYNYLAFMERFTPFTKRYAIEYVARKIQSPELFIHYLRYKALRILTASSFLKNAEKNGWIPLKLLRNGFANRLNENKFALILGDSAFVIKGLELGDIVDIGRFLAETKLDIRKARRGPDFYRIYDVKDTVKKADPTFFAEYNYEVSMFRTSWITKREEGFLEETLLKSIEKEERKNEWEFSL